MRILAIDTSCDETAASVTEGRHIVSNIVWSQASAHAKFGGVMPSLAQRMHEERIDWVIHKALGKKHKNLRQIDAIAVTVGPGLSIALGVGVNKAKELSKKYKRPLIPVNHIEAHILSPLALSKNDKETNIRNLFPAYGLCLSGKNTMFVLVESIGNYKIIADTEDDALGEALDKAARMLGFGYPGGYVLEKMAHGGRKGKFTLPVPLIGQEHRKLFSYSGIKTSFYRLIDSYKSKDADFPSKQDICDLAFAFQDSSFRHIERVLNYVLQNDAPTISPKSMFLGGGVAANIEIRKRVRRLGKKFGLSLLTPYSKKLYGDNAAMIGITAYLKVSKNIKVMAEDIKKIDRNPKLKLGGLI